MTRKFIFLILFSLLFFQLIYSFIYPSVGKSGTGLWLSLPELISHEKSPLDSSEVSLINKFSPILSRYNVNADGGVYILLARDFPQYYFENPIMLSRPLYSALIAIFAFLPRLFFDSLATVFASAILVNFILAFGTILLFYLLVEKIISSRVAFLSSFLFIFSPLVHARLIQPVPELLGTLMIAAALYMLYDYVKNPSRLKLIAFSLTLGIFMLGKMFFAPAILILTLAVYFKRYQEGIIFLLIHLMPLVFWYFWVTQIFRLEFYEAAVKDFGAVTWLLNIPAWPWHKTFRVFLDILPQFISSVLYGFLVLPIIFALIGFKHLLLANKKIICLSFAFSLLATFFITNFYFPRHAFLLFPMVYPLAVLGMDKVADFLKKYKNWYSLVFYLTIFIFLLIISNIDIYKVFSFG